MIRVPFVPEDLLIVILGRGLVRADRLLVVSSSLVASAIMSRFDTTTPASSPRTHDSAVLPELCWMVRTSHH